LAGFGFIFPGTDAKLYQIGHFVGLPTRARQNISAFSNVKRAGPTASVANETRIAVFAPKVGYNIVAKPVDVCSHCPDC